MEMVSTQEVSRRRDRGLLLQREGNLHRLPRADLYVLSSFNVDLLPPFLCEALERIGFYGEIHLGQFGQLAQAILAPDSDLYRVAPGGVVLMPAVEDMLAPLYERPLALSSEAGEALAEERAGELQRLVQVLLERLPNSSCYIVPIGTDCAPLEQILDPRASGRGQVAVERLVDHLRGLGALSPRVVTVDWDWHTRGTGMAAFRDERLWYLGRMRLNPLGLATAAELIACHVAAHRGTLRKVVALDLDNTLWGGVVGEVGLSGLVLGEEGLGLAFQDFQRGLLRLHDTGVLLAICSKNNPDDAWEVFDRHPAMVLRREHIAAARINWQDKVTNLREIGEELNLGTDSFVFLDDNPVEREWIRAALPQVLTPDLPKDPTGYPSFLHRMPHFQRITTTEADTRRAETYRAQGLRRQLQASVASLEEFLVSLEQEVTIDRVTEGAVSRAAQMCQRTNQFNLTTRRYTVAEIDQMRQDPAFELYTLSVRDRFGDSGITGLGILKFSSDAAEIDTFLLSCRILGRRLEDVLLAMLVNRARLRGVRCLYGRFVASAKNSQVADFYPQRGFEPVEEGLFRLELAQQSSGAVPGVKVTLVANE
jgi:FkbH-like protein